MKYTLLLIALLAAGCGASPVAPSAPPSLASLLSPSLPTTDARFEAAFYSQLAHGTFDTPSSPTPIRRLMRSPSVFVQRAGLSDDFVARVEATFREEIPAFTGGALTLARFESGDTLRPDADGWIVFELVADDATACGNSKVGASAGHAWINTAAKCASRGEPVAFVSLYAHELGHALGFFHVDFGLMQASVTFDQQLTEREKFHGAAAYAQPNGSTK